MDVPMFRIWYKVKQSVDAASKEWTYKWQMSPVQVLQIHTGEVILDSKYGFANRMHKIGRDCILMQSLGIKDVNQKPVYVGDIVKITDTQTGKEYTGHVEGRGAVYYVDVQGEELFIKRDMAVEVLGNVYEQPELKP
ncbi:YopX family protein [Dethiobacter alkaliphilus]|uniref:YopX family protein n=1 Tax=Dethiobacter alkaliphilus TaxID=427926 RepID=UPI002227EF2B|nr:YopX family protein [Dethiobacter alkaliphilus]MCW3489450.1 YopX family protein [Dethiobacter alkaliphilus]